MKQATLPLYIRFGEIPGNNQSKVHLGDSIVRNEGGVSVWRAVEANGNYFPIMHDDINENGVSDYFQMIFSDMPVFLVTGQEMRIEGADREPLLIDVTIIKKLNYDYLRKAFQ